MNVINEMLQTAQTMGIYTWVQWAKDRSFKAKQYQELDADTYYDCACDIECHQVKTNVFTELYKAEAELYEDETKNKYHLYCSYDNKYYYLGARTLKELENIRKGEIQ